MKYIMLYMLSDIHLEEVMRETIDNLYNMQPNEINQVAIDKLDEMLDRCTINLIAALTGITRTTLYRWLDPKLPLDVMDYKQAAWLILVCETSPKIQLLLSRPPLSHPRLAKRITDEV